MDTVIDYILIYLELKGFKNFFFQIGELGFIEIQ